MFLKVKADNVSELVARSSKSDSTSAVGIEALLTDAVITIYQWIILAVVCQGIDIFGIGTNIVNIICFVKQGFNDPVNVSLLGLSVSDLGCLTTLTWTNICFTPALATADIPFDPTEIHYLTSSMPHTAFTRITAWITALITLERCFCITIPLKVSRNAVSSFCCKIIYSFPNISLAAKQQVKQIITTKRISVTIMVVYIILISTAAPVYVVMKLGMKFYPHRNKTLLGLVYSEDRFGVEQTSYVINNALIPFTAFVIIIVGTITLVASLRRKTKWRQNSALTGQDDIVSVRNQRVAKMVVIISVIFIACFVPFGIIFIAMSVEPEFSISGKYKNMLTIVGGFCLVLESINSAGNIFVYYHMSSKYREIFRNIFRVN